MTDKVMHQVRLFLILGILKNTYVIYTNSDLPNFPFTSIPLPATTQNGRVAGLVVSPFRFSKISPKCLTSNPLPQIVTSNPRSQPDTHFAVDMFPYKKTELFQKSGFKSKPPKKPGNTPLSGTYLSFLDINTTVSTVFPLSHKSSVTSPPSLNTGKFRPIRFSGYSDSSFL
jgi:hypothetical protein